MSSSESDSDPVYDVALQERFIALAKKKIIESRETHLQRAAAARAQAAGHMAPDYNVSPEQDHADPLDEPPEDDEFAAHMDQWKVNGRPKYVFDVLIR